MPSARARELSAGIRFGLPARAGASRRIDARCRRGSRATAIRRCLAIKGGQCSCIAHRQVKMKKTDIPLLLFSLVVSAQSFGGKPRVEEVEFASHGATLSGSIV